MRTALRHRGFRRTTFLYAADVLLEWLASIALMVLVYRATDSATAAAAMLLCKQVAPGLLVSVAGAVVDRAAPGRALAVSLVVQAAALATIGIVGYGAPLFVLAVACGTAGALVRSSLRAAVACSLRGDELRAGNALLNVIAATFALAGPACAAFAVLATDPGAVLLAAAAAMALAGVAATLWPVDTHRPRLEPSASEDGASDPEPGMAHGVPLAWLLGLVALLTCIFSMDDPALLAYSQDALGAGVGGYGAIFTAWGLGVALGSLLFARLLDWPMLRIYALATILAGGAYVGMSISPSITVTCAIAVVGGVGNGMDWVAIMTAVQEATPPGEEAVTARRLEAFATAGPGVGIVLGGLLTDLVSPRTTLLVPGVLALMILALGAIAVRGRAARATAHASGHTTFTPSIHGGPA